MLGFHDTTRVIDERNEARMNFRTKPRIKTAIQQAAALSGVDDSVFPDEEGPALRQAIGLSDRRRALQGATSTLGRAQRRPATCSR